MLVSCEFCAKVWLEGGQWVESDLEAQPLAICPTCMVKRQTSAKRGKEALRQESVRRMERGYDPDPDDETFRGFRDDDQ